MTETQARALIGQERRTSTRRSTVTTADGARIALYEDGDPDAPLTVLLSHGWTLSAAGWSPHVAALLGGGLDGGLDGPVRVVSFDQRGHGGSERGIAPIDVSTFGADLAAVLEAACRDRPVVVLGHSLGGMALLACACDRPELFGDPVVGAVLVSASAGAPPARGRRARFEQALVDGVLRRAWAAELMHRLLTGPGAHPRTRPLWRLAFGDGPDAELARRSAEDFRPVPVAEIAAYYWAFAAHDRGGRFGALGRVPVEVLVGAEDRFATPVEAAAIAAQLDTSARLRIVPGYGHDLPYDRPDLMVRAVGAVLRRGAHAVH